MGLLRRGALFCLSSVAQRIGPTATDVRRLQFWTDVRHTVAQRTVALRSYVYYHTVHGGRVPVRLFHGFSAGQLEINKIITHGLKVILNAICVAHLRRDEKDTRTHSDIRLLSSLLGCTT